MNNGLTWIDIQNPNREIIIDVLETNNYLNFIHELNIEDCLSKNNIPKLDKYKEYIFLILYFPSKSKTYINMNEKKLVKSKRKGTVNVLKALHLKSSSTLSSSSSSSIHVSQLSIFAGMNFLITIHQGDLLPLNELFESAKQENTNTHNTIKNEYIGKSSGYLLHSILDILVDDLLHILIKLRGNLKDIEDAVFDYEIEVSKEISLMRREITMLKTNMYPLKRIINSITTEIQRFSEEDLIHYYENVLDHIDKVIEIIESSNATIEIYKDTDFMLSAEKTNKILAILTILFTFSLPATVIGTFYGMNINLPGGIVVGAWTFLGPYTTLIIVLMMTIIPTLIMYIYFLKLGWLKY
ncbi:MAG: magnesium transporter CorA family protein [Nitrososphaeraceae archaeon]